MIIDTHFSIKMSVVLHVSLLNIFYMVQMPVNMMITLMAYPVGVKTFSIPELHDDVIKWKHFPHNWPFVRKIHRSPVNFPHKGQWRGALMFSLIYAWINDWVNKREAGDLRRQHGHYDAIVMTYQIYDHIYDKFPDGYSISQKILLVLLWLETNWFCPLQWRHNDNDSVSNHQPYDCLLNRLFGRRSK